MANGAHGGTYGGNALAAAAAVATIGVMLDENLADNSARTGHHLLSSLKDLQAEYPIIGDVRGRGLMVGVEFGQAGKPDKVPAKRTQQAAIERNLLLLTCGTHDNVIRWIPPLVVNDEQIDASLSIFAEALATASHTA
jgi:4-aminobutyrate aminotransferase